MLIKDVRFEEGSKFRGVVAEYKMVAILEDGTEESIGRYFTDEKSYRKEDFVGMSMAEARNKFVEDDKRYLQS